MVALKSIKAERRRLADAVYDQLLTAIQDNEIGHEDRLVQERLAAQLQISRTPVREALLRLEQEGVLVSSPRGGFVLYRMTEPEILQLYEARIAVEGHAAHILAGRNDAKINQRLRETIASEEEIDAPSVRAYFEANRSIHRRFIELIGNRYLLEMFDNIWNRAVSFQLFSAIEKIDLAQSLGEHVELVDAIESGDGTVALDAMIAHIQRGFELQMQAVGSE